MPRFFFDVRLLGEAVWVDHQGVDLTDLGAAHQHALFRVQQVTKCFEDHHDWRGWNVRVADARHRTMLNVIFSTAVRPSPILFRQGSYRE